MARASPNDVKAVIMVQNPAAQYLQNFREEEVGVENKSRELPNMTEHVPLAQD